MEDIKFNLEHYLKEKSKIGRNIKVVPIKSISGTLHGIDYYIEEMKIQNEIIKEEVKK